MISTRQARRIRWGIQAALLDTQHIGDRPAVWGIGMKAYWRTMQRIATPSQRHLIAAERIRRHK